MGESISFSVSHLVVLGELREDEDKARKATQAVVEEWHAEVQERGFVVTGDVFVALMPLLYRKPRASRFDGDLVARGKVERASTDD